MSEQVLSIFLEDRCQSVTNYYERKIRQHEAFIGFLCGELFRYEKKEDILKRRLFSLEQELAEKNKQLEEYKKLNW